MPLPPLTAAALPFGMFSPICFELPSAVRHEMAQRLYEGKLTLREAVASGYATTEKADDWVDFWHEKSIPCELRELLGLSREEYAEWMRDSSRLAIIFSPEPEQVPARIFAEDDFVPMSYWGKDHWSTLAYLETVMTDMGGFQVGADPRMKSNRRNFRVMTRDCAKPKRASSSGSGLGIVMEPHHATKLNDEQQVPGHDDWSCVQDMAAEGLFVQSEDEVQPGVTLRFSERGNQIANALREFKRDGGKYYAFRWPGVPKVGVANAPAAPAA